MAFRYLGFSSSTVSEIAIERLLGRGLCMETFSSYLTRTMARYCFKPIVKELPVSVSVSYKKGCAMKFKLVFPCASKLDIQRHLVKNMMRNSGNYWFCWFAHRNRVLRSGLFDQLKALHFAKSINRCV